MYGILENPDRRFLKISSLCLIGSASAAAAASGIADSLSIALFAAVFAASWFLNTARLREFLPARFFAFAAIVYLCFIPVDRFLLSSDWQRVLLHAIWFAAAVKLITRADDKDWPPLYFICSIQWILTAVRPTETVFWICLAVFIVSGISSLMLLELRRSPIRTLKENEETAEKSGFPFRAFFIAVPGITAAVTIAAIPLFFFFPRLPAKSGATPSDTAPTYTYYHDDIETLELGSSGLPQQPEVIVMRVKTDIPEDRLHYGLKWRGVSYDYYDGRAWTLRRREQQTVATQGRFYKLEESAMGSELMQQTFFMEETLTNTVFAAHRALAVSTDAGFLRRDSSDNLFTQYPARGKTDYIVVSDTIIPDADKISDWTPVPDDIRTTWLQLPKLDPRVMQLANDITRGYSRSFDKALAIETWLRSNYAYTQTPHKTHGVSEGGDPLAVFLFDAREGYCEYFATAMTVMLRVIGIPARMAGGFSAGEYNPVGGSWTVRRKHSHIWTEAWFPPYGWIEFDATPGDEFPAEPARSRFFTNLADAAGLWWRENVAGYDASRQYSVISGFFTGVNRVEDRVGEFISSSANRLRIAFKLPPQTTLVIKITASIILFAAVLWIVLFRWMKRRFPGVFRLSKQNPRGDAADFYAKTLIFLKARGFSPERTQTPMEFAHNLAHPAASALLDLTRFYNEVRFGDPTVPFPRDKSRELMCSLKTAFGRENSDYTRERKLFLCMREDYCRKARKD